MGWFEIAGINVLQKLQKRLVKSIPRHLKAVVDVKGYPTKHELNEKWKYLLIGKDFFKCMKTFVR